MIGIVRSKIVTVPALAGAALVLASGLFVQPAWAYSGSQVCAQDGHGYCINDWGGAGRAGDAVNMYTSGTGNNAFYVQEVNRCGGRDTVQSTAYGDSTNCPFGDTAWDESLRGDKVVQIVYANNPSECVGTMGGSLDAFYAVLAPCANAASGAGGGNGVIDVLYPQPLGTLFVNRYWTDEGGAGAAVLDSSGYVSGPAEFLSPASYWGGYALYQP